MDSAILLGMTPLEKKRWQLWGLSFILLLSSSAAVVAFGLTTAQPPIMIVFLAVLLLLFCAYVIENEIKLQRLNKLLLDEQFKSLEEQVKVAALQARLKELTVLQMAMEAIGMETQPEKALDTILRAGMELFGADRGSIMLVHDESQTLVMASSVGLPPDLARRTRPKVGEGIAGWVVQTGEPLLLGPTVNGEHFRNFVQKGGSLRSGICAPLRSRNLTIGVINYTVLDPHKRLLTEYDLKLLTIFSQYATLVMDAAGAARLN